MKKFLSLLLIPFLLSQCNYENRYDKGYEAAWEGEDEPNEFWSSQKEKDGYEAGLYDVDMYDDGYDDGREGKGPKYLNDSFYMDGYKDGKNYG